MKERSKVVDVKNLIRALIQEYDNEHGPETSFDRNKKIAWSISKKYSKIEINYLIELISDHYEFLSRLLTYVLVVYSFILGALLTSLFKNSSPWNLIIVSLIVVLGSFLLISFFTNLATKHSFEYRALLKMALDFSEKQEKESKKFFIEITKFNKSKDMQCLNEFISPSK